MQNIPPLKQMKFNDMPTCYHLIGVPGSGKTTWYNNQPWSKNCAYISTDKYIEKFAESLSKTYTEVFERYMPAAVNLMVQEVQAAREQRQDIVWDQTSVTPLSRLKKFKMLPDYEHIAVVFSTPELRELVSRLESRPGKEIPWTVLEDMIEKFTYPTFDEGYSEIWNAE